MAFCVYFLPNEFNEIYKNNAIEQKNIFAWASANSYETLPKYLIYDDSTCLYTSQILSILDLRGSDFCKKLFLGMLTPNN